MRQPEFEAISPEELELLQLERLQSTLTRAYRQVKFYRRRFDEAGLTPGSIQTLTDLARLPLTTRGDLSENYPYGLFALPLKDIVRIISSPGTTDRPLVVGYSSQECQTVAGTPGPPLHRGRRDPGRHRATGDPPGARQLAP